MSTFYEECQRLSLLRHGNADFGTTAIGALPTLADVSSLTANYDKWIPLLRTRFQRIESAWSVSDAAGETDFETDLANLEKRYAAAKLLALGDKGLDTALLPFLLPAATLSGAYSWLRGGKFSAIQGSIPASVVYHAYLAALRQGSLTNGDGAPEQKGDYSNLVKRVTDEENALEMPAPPELASPSVIQPDPSLDQSSNVLKDTPKGASPSEISYWMKLAVVGVGVALVTNLIQTAISARREFREGNSRGAE
jgi:hypothetical protein